MAPFSDTYLKRHGRFFFQNQLWNWPLHAQKRPDCLSSYKMHPSHPRRPALPCFSRVTVVWTWTWYPVTCHVRSQVMGTAMVTETSDSFGHLTRLMAREDFSNFHIFCKCALFDFAYLAGLDVRLSSQ